VDRKGVEGRDDGALYSTSQIRIVTMNPPLYNEHILIKILFKKEKEKIHDIIRKRNISKTK
jgi:hypothetical protein